ncbi:MAG: hypothetical protein ABIH50_06680 [bacterium]
MSKIENQININPNNNIKAQTEAAYANVGNALRDKTISALARFEEINDLAPLNLKNENVLEETSSQELPFSFSYGPIGLKVNELI